MYASVVICGRRILKETTCFDKSVIYEKEFCKEFSIYIIQFNKKVNPVNSILLTG